MPEINRNAFPAARSQSSQTVTPPSLPPRQSALGVDIPPDELAKIREKLAAAQKDIQVMTVLLIIGLLSVVGMLIACLGSLLFFIKAKSIDSNQYLKPMLKELSGLKRKELKKVSEQRGFQAELAHYLLSRSNAYWPLVITATMVVVIGGGIVYMKFAR